MALKTGQLVCWDVTTARPKGGEVQPADQLSKLCVTTELADAGWQLVDVRDDWSVLARDTGKTKWLSAWTCFVKVVEVVQVGTGVQNGAVVATVGETVTKRAFCRADHR